MAVPQIVNAMRRAIFVAEWRFDDPHQRIDDVVDIGEVAPQLAAAEHRELACPSESNR